MLGQTLRVCATASLALVLAFAAAPLAAQGTGMSEQQMTDALLRQKTRGLSIAPVSQGTAPDSTGTAGASVAAENFAILPKDEQVNINISFDFDSAALREDQKPKLVALCNAVKGAGVEKLRIVGHTDSSGSAAYNQRLSLLRAEEVKRHLAASCELPLDQLEAVGMGKDALFDPADPRGEINRRVEFQALS